MASQNRHTLDQRLRLRHEETGRLGSLDGQLAGMLRDGAESTAPQSEAVRASRTLDAVLVSDEATCLNGTAERQEARQDVVARGCITAVLGSRNLVGNLAGREAPRNQKNLNVGEAVEKTGVPLSSHSPDFERNKAMK